MISRTKRKRVAKYLAKYAGEWLRNTEIADATRLSNYVVGFLLRGKTNPHVQRRQVTVHTRGRTYSHIYYKTDVDNVAVLLDVMMPRHTIQEAMWRSR